MAYTGSQAIALVKMHLNAVSSGGNWDTDDLLSYLNISLKQIAKVCPSDLLGSELGLNTTLVVSNVASPNIPVVAIPATLLAFRSMLLGYTPIYKRSIDFLAEQFVQDANRPYKATNAAEKAQYYAVHDRIYFFPRYTTQQQYTLLGVKKPTELTLSNNLDCHEALQDLVTMYAAQLALQADGRMESAGMQDAKVQREINFLAKKFDIDVQDFALPMTPGQPAPVQTA